MRVIVIGAGIIGASVAWQLVRAGADVVVVDAGEGGATARSFGWINASFYADAAHHRLRVAGMEAYARLSRALPDLPVTVRGALWWEHGGAELTQMQAELEALGYPVRRVSREAALQIEPELRGLPEEVLHFPSEGVAESAHLAALLLAQAQRGGAQVLLGTKVRAILAEAGRVTGVATEAHAVAADHVVVAAGTGAQALLASVDVALPMLSRPGAMVITKPVAARIGSVLVTPEGEVRQLPDGRLMSPAVAGHQGDTAEAITEPLEQIAAQTSARIAPLVGLEHLAWEEVGIGYRPVPADGLPAIGMAGPEGLAVAVMHSGVTLAAIAGEVVADMIMKKASPEHSARLAPYSVARFKV